MSTEGIGHWPHPDVLDQAPPRFSVTEIGAYRGHSQVASSLTQGQRPSLGYRTDPENDQDCPNRSAWIDTILSKRRKT
jgi:hypothetical protein